MTAIRVLLYRQPRQKTSQCPGPRPGHRDRGENECPVQPFLPQLSFLGQEMQRCFVIATNSTGTNLFRNVSTLLLPPTCRDGLCVTWPQNQYSLPVGRRKPTWARPWLLIHKMISCWGFSDLLVYASIFFHLLMQAIEVEEHFHGQHAYATPSDLTYFKTNQIKQFLGERLRTQDNQRKIRIK